MSMNLSADFAKPVLIYDTECFFCTNYVRLLALKKSVGDITLVSARDKQAVRALNCEHLDLNAGMVLLLGSQCYFGDEAVYHLALLSTPVTFFNRLNRIIFRHYAMARLWYPLLKLGRRTYLRLAGKDEIR